jgi:hypothetical protein
MQGLPIPGSCGGSADSFVDPNTSTQLGIPIALAPRILMPRWKQLSETLWVQPDLRERIAGAARLIEKGVVCL